MLRLQVKVKKLNKRKAIPAWLPEPSGIIGVVNEKFIFLGEKVTVIPNPSVGTWYKDRDQNYYWGGGLEVLDEIDVEETTLTGPDNPVMEGQASVTPLQKRKIEQVINAFETGSAQGNYSSLAKHHDYLDPATNKRIQQITFGRSQTTEFGHLRSLLLDYVNRQGIHAAAFQPFLHQIGRKPSLATDDVFCDLLKRSGNDPVMKQCQDDLFDAKYYQPAFSWFLENGFRLPLSMLVIYDSYIHSGSILKFLRRRFITVVPASGGDEKEWISEYVRVRHQWLLNHSDALLRKTVYRTNCFMDQLQLENWDLSQTIRANGNNII